MAIKTSKSGRLGKLMGLGAKVASQSIVGVMTARSAIETRIEQAKAIAETLAELKGAAMKFGQILSIQGEYFLPKEVTSALQKLQNAAPAFSGDEMRRIAAGELGEEKLSRIVFEPKPLAAASIGQVHRVILPGNEPAVMKIQYPGVDLAIDAEIQILKRIMSVFAKIYIDRFDVDPVVEEVKRLLQQELDYTLEAGFMVRFREALSGDDRYRVPRLHPEYSSRRALTMSFEEGMHLDAFLATEPSQAVRNQVGRDLIDLYLREVYEMRIVQTDPNFANYLFKPSASGKVQIVCLDFGACKVFTEEFVGKYREFVKGLDRDDPDSVLPLAHELGFLHPDESQEAKDLFYEMCRLNLEPVLLEGDFDFARSDLPKRMQEVAFRFLKTIRRTPPPKDILFLNRKMGGMYSFMAKLGVRANFRELFVQRELGES